VVLAELVTQEHLAVAQQVLEVFLPLEHTLTQVEALVVHLPRVVYHTIKELL
jgi:hypothetical protein